MLVIGLIIALAFISLLTGFFLWRTHNELRYFRDRFSLTQSQLIQELKKHENLQLEFSELRSKLDNSLLSDPLTGLTSRVLFEDRVKSAINQSSRYQLTFAVMFLDFDGFKMINDALGHVVGDELLKEASQRLLISIRQVDTISRFNGDEFVFLLPQLAKAETAAYIAQRFLDVIDRPFHIRDENLYITASIGIAVYPVDGDDVQTLLTHATNALHQAKSSGRNMYQFYRAEMQENSLRELLLSSSLRSDFLFQELLLYFQPQVNIETKSIVCMCAMISWQHNDFGMIPWNSFAILAENSGKIVGIGEWVLRHACQYYLSWQKQNFHPGAISIQTTLKQIENSHFIQKISNVLQDTKIAPEHIMLEISEASLVTHTEMMEKMLHMLKHLGIRILISNFGTGHLSLQALRNLPVDGLKIDSSFIRDITISKESKAIIQMVIALAKSLNLMVIADGVEVLAQKEVLQELGCTIMQGPLFGSSVLAHELSSSVTQKMSEIL